MNQFEHVRTFGPGGSSILAMDFVRQAEGGELLAVVEASDGVHLYDKNGNLQRSLNSAEGGSIPVYQLAYLPRSEGWPFLAMVGGSDMVTIADPATGELMPPCRTPGDERPVCVDALLGPRGSMVAAGTKAGKVFVWNWPSGELRLSLEVDQLARVQAMKVLRQEGWLAVAHDAGISVWDLRSEDPAARRIDFGEGDNRSLAVIYDGKGNSQLASACEHGIQLWDPATGRQVGRRFGIGQDIKAMVAVPGPHGQAGLAAAVGRKVVIWSPATERSTTLPEQLPGRINALAKILAGDGTTLLAAGDESGNIALWQQRPGRFTAGEGRHTGWVNAVIPLRRQPDGFRAKVAAASDDGLVGLWRLNGHETKPGVERAHYDEQGRLSQVQALTLIGENRFASGDERGYLRIWGLDGTARSGPWKSGHGRIRALTAYQVGEHWHLVAGGGQGKVSIWHTPAAADDDWIEAVDRIGILAAHGRDQTLVRAVAMAGAPGTRSPMIVAAHSDGYLAAWDLADHDSPLELPGLTLPAQARALAAWPSAEGRLLAAGTDDGCIRVWQTTDPDAVDAEPLPPAQWTLLREIEHAHRGQVSALTAVDADGQWLLASGGADGRLKLWEPLRDDSLLSDRAAHTNWVRAVTQSFRRPQVELISGGDDGAVRSWRLEKLDLVPDRMGLLLRGFADRPATSDLLDREDVADTLIEIMRPDDTSFALHGTVGPQVITVEGRWGEGKTSFMRDVQRRLTEHQPPTPAPEGRRSWRNVWRDSDPDLTPRAAAAMLRSSLQDSQSPKVDEPDRRTVTVWFNPWTHQSAPQVWSGLAGTMIEQLSDWVAATRAGRQRYWLRRNLDRIDREALRRRLYRATFRPLTVAGKVLALPIVTGVAVNLLSGRTPAGPGAPISGYWFVAAAVVFAAMLGWSVARFTMGRAISYLPAEMLSRPLPPGSHSGRLAVLNAAYQGDAGQLYWTQDDAYRTVGHLIDRGLHLVIFIDDLDRCAVRTTSEVFEAIIGFLSAGQDRATGNGSSGGTGMRQFVLGLDPLVVSARLADAYRSPDGDKEEPDPYRRRARSDIGWAHLRRVSQLSVILPATQSSHTYRLLHAHTPGQRTTGSAKEPGSRPTPSSPGQAPSAPATPTGTPSAADGTTDPDTTPPPTVPSRQPTGSHERYLEGDPVVQAHLQDLMRMRPSQSMRETKRLLTLWGFYMRLLRKLLPPDALSTSQAACDAMTLAEIICRWPAFVPALTRTFDRDRIGLSLAWKAAHEDDAHWRSMLRKLELVDTVPGDAERFRALLKQHGTRRVVEYGYYLL